MRILVQWSLATPGDWSTIDLGVSGAAARAWRNLPRKPVPVGGDVIDEQRGWVYDVAVQGVLLGGHDHYAAEPIIGDGVLFTHWDDDPEDWPAGTRHAWQWTFRPGIADRSVVVDGATIRHRGPDQSLTIYAEPAYRERLPSVLECGGQFVIFRPWSAFTAPVAAVTLHGVWLSDELDRAHAAARRKVDWREWA